MNGRRLGSKRQQMLQPRPSQENREVPFLAEPPRTQPRQGARPSASVSLPRERFWDFPVAKIDSPTRQPMCPGRPASAARSHAPLVRGIPRLPHWLDGARMRFAARPLARKRTPALLNRLAPTGDYWPRASPFHGQQRVLNGELPLKLGTLGKPYISSD
jgi:hypothetical protein